jgi:LysM repeat protein
MDNLSSADLDASSKTPLFIGIAAVIIAVIGVWLGWLGFSKANELEARIAEISGAAESLSKLESTVNDNSEMLRKAAGKITSIESNLGTVTTAIEKDVADVKRSMRSVAMQAGTALKKAEALEKEGVPVAASPAPTPSAPTAKGDPSSASSSSISHTIASGDTYGKLSTKYKVSVNALLDANPGVDPRRLRIGQKIIIPSAQ